VASKKPRARSRSSAISRQSRGIQTRAVDNFTAIRNGILEHLASGNLSPFDLGVYLYLHLRADWATGIYRGCALTVAHGFDDPALRGHINKSLIRLRSRKYINYRKGDGRRGGYPILINKYHVTVGELSFHRLDAWKHGQLCKPEYEPWNGRGTVEELSRHGDGTVMAPIQDLKTLQDVKRPGENPSFSRKRKTRKASLPADFCISEAVRKWAEEKHHTRLEERLEHFICYAKANGKQYADWDAAFKNAIRGDWANLKGKSNSAPATLPATYVSVAEKIRAGLATAGGRTQ